MFHFEPVEKARDPDQTFAVGQEEPGKDLLSEIRPHSVFGRPETGGEGGGGSFSIGEFRPTNHPAAT